METTTQYDNSVNTCRNIFVKKVQDYGTSWRVLRMISIVDQIYIKALRIRTIQDVPDTGIRTKNTNVRLQIPVEVGIPIRCYHRPRDRAVRVVAVDVECHTAPGFVMRSLPLLDPLVIRPLVCRKGRE